MSIQSNINKGIAIAAGVSALSKEKNKAKVALKNEENFKSSFEALKPMQQKHLIQNEKALAAYKKTIDERNELSGLKLSPEAMKNAEKGILAKQRDIIATAKQDNKLLQMRLKAKKNLENRREAIEQLKDDMMNYSKNPKFGGNKQ